MHVINEKEKIVMRRRTVLGSPDDLVQIESDMVYEYLRDYISHNRENKSLSMPAAVTIITQRGLSHDQVWVENTARRHWGFLTTTEETESEPEDAMGSRPSQFCTIPGGFFDRQQASSPASMSVLGSGSDADITVEHLGSGDFIDILNVESNESFSVVGTSDVMEDDALLEILDTEAPMKFHLLTSPFSTQSGLFHHHDDAQLKRDAETTQWYEEDFSFQA